MTIPALALSALLAYPPQAAVEASASQPAGKSAREALLIGTGVTLHSPTPAWATGIGIIAGWTLTGVISWMAGGPVLPVPLMAVAGILSLERAIGSTAPIGPADGEAGRSRRLSLVLRLNLASMALVWFLASASSECNPLSPGNRGACIQRSEVTSSLSWRSGPSRMLTVPLNLLIDWVWSRYRGTAERRWSVLVAPILHDDGVTGAGIGLAFAL